MKGKLFSGIRIFLKEPQWAKVRGVLWFIAITLVFHILWRMWANTFYFMPVQHFVYSVRSFLVHQVYDESVYILRDLLNITVYLEPHVIITKNGIRLILGESASGLKQICQFVVLILLFSGKLKHKAWFIPAGIIILHLTNVFRIICLVVIAMHWPQQIQYAHDNYLRIVYYIVIFGLWLVWVEKIAPGKQDRRSG